MPPLKARDDAKQVRPFGWTYTDLSDEFKLTQSPAQLTSSRPGEFKGSVVP
jgi:hypothetical protein